MKSFFKSLAVFFLFLFVFTEIAARIFHISTDAPKTYKNDNGNVNYYPNQEGYWDGGAHKWYINALGHPGKNLPESFDNLALLIGDSYIQNFMNPDSCHQSVFLKQLKPELNYVEVAMDGLNLLGYFEYSKPMDSLNPKLKIIYVNNDDFKNTILDRDIVHSNRYRVNINNSKIVYPEYRGSKLKDLLYNFKFSYYLYRKNLGLFSNLNTKDDLESKDDKYKRGNEFSELDYVNASKLLDFIIKNYRTDNVLFVFHPNSDSGLIQLTEEKGFNVMEIYKDPNENWKTENDGHWNWFAHKKIATQIVVKLEKMN